eukprot:TRINITY_DN35712_c0_g1_i1.p1 TRINITY_DN35712_c0_g1~~TRINITY_DN35712_c0_g1_i1.p1  ORF type:complete len:279 (-),score=44.55 TRINITY_DN35712_c0_g1_i1:252-1088(-)
MVLRSVRWPVARAAAQSLRCSGRSFSSLGGLAVVRNVRGTTGEDAAAWIKQGMQDYFARYGAGIEYRSNAAWSLRQMDDRFSILREGNLVIDLGCFSGGWSQVAVERTGGGAGGGRVIGVDKVRMKALNGHTFIQGDVAEPETLASVLEELGECKADVVLSDVAPQTVGLKLEDHLGSAQCCLQASNIMEKTLRLGGWYVVKMLYGPESANFRLYLNTRFETVRTLRPRASRNVYREMFFICRGFIGRRGIAEEVSAKGNFGTRHEGLDRWGSVKRKP